MFEFRIKFGKIDVSGFEISEKAFLIFLLVSLPGAVFVKHRVLVILKGFAGVKSDLICLALSLVSMLEPLVL